MALSLFIKQLLETDSIFGGEAKKLSGINDFSVLDIYQLATVSLVNDPFNFYIDITNSTNPINDIPSFLTTNKYIAITLDPWSSIINSVVTEVSFVRRRFRVESTVKITNGYRINLDRDANGSNTFETRSLSNVEAVIDGRIFAVIDDPTIAKEANNGSTMFNVNSSVTTGLEDGSGLAQKYAAHYHAGESSVGFEIVSHETNIRGKEIAGVDIEMNAPTQSIVFNQAEAARDYLESVRDGNIPSDISIRVSTLDSAQTTIAHYVLDPAPDLAIAGLSNASTDITAATPEGLALKRHSAVVAPDIVTAWDFVFGATAIGEASGRQFFLNDGSAANNDTPYTTGGNWVINLTVNNGTNESPYLVGPMTIPSSTTPNQIAQVIANILNNPTGTINVTFRSQYAATVSASNELVITSKTTGAQFNTVGNGLRFVSTLSTFPITNLQLTGGLSSATRVVEVPIPAQSAIPRKVSNSVYINNLVNRINTVIGDTDTANPRNEWRAQLTYFPNSLPASAPIQPDPNNIIASIDITVKSVGTSETTRLTFGPFADNSSLSFTVLQAGAFNITSGEYINASQLAVILNDRITNNTNLNGRITAQAVSPGGVPGTVNIIETPSGTAQPLGSFNIPIRFDYESAIRANTLNDNFPCFVALAAEAGSGLVPLPLVSSINPTNPQVQALFEGRITPGTPDELNFESEFELLEILNRSEFFKSTRDANANTEIAVSSRLTAEGINIIFTQPADRTIWTSDGTTRIDGTITIGGIRQTTYTPAGPDVVFDANGNAIFQVASS